MSKPSSTLSKLFKKFSSSSSSTHSTMSKQTLTILGATGKQGGSVVKSILADSKASSKFQVRAVTRDPTKDSAKALEALGAEVVAVRVMTVAPSLVLLILF